MGYLRITLDVSGERFLCDWTVMQVPTSDAGIGDAWGRKCRRAGGEEGSCSSAGMGYAQQGRGDIRVERVVVRTRHVSTFLHPEILYRAVLPSPRSHPK